MKIRQFEEILKGGEGTLVEFKKSVSSSLGKEICAFANTAGGRIFVGIDDHNKIIGCKLTNKMKSQIQDIAKNCDPKIAVNVETIKYDNKEVVMVTVPESKDKPVQCKEGFFLREGANSQKMSRDEIFYWAQRTRKIRYENQLRQDFKYSKDFNKEIFHELLKRLNVTIGENREDLLHNLGLGDYEDEDSFIFNNAGIMFFGKKRDLYIRQVYVTCVLYKGIEKIKIIDRKDFRTGLVRDYENAFNFLQQHLRLEYVIEGGGPRKEIPEIPYEALKEALLNAIIHRDYFEIGARVMVEIFDDRVEISNPGELLFDKEYFGRKSVARNPIIFDIFNRLDLVEKVGTGIKRIMSAVEERGLNVEFEINGFFTIIFQRPPLMYQASTQQVPSKHPASTPQASPMYPPGTLQYPASIQKAVGQLKITWDKFNDFVLSLSQACPKSVPCEIAAVILLLTQKEISIMDLMKALSKTNRTRFKKDSLNPLIEAGLISLTIPGKPQSPRQKYVITEKGKQLLKKQKT